MLSANYRRLYHYHLKKTGGSTFNQWLDTFTYDDRAFNFAWNWSWAPPDQVGDASAAGETDNLELSPAVIHWSDVIHSHAPIRKYMPDRTLNFTVLRNPVERVVSQITDWRRLTSEHTSRLPAALAEMISDAGRLPMRAYLERHAWGEGRIYFDNYLTRALAAGRDGRAALRSDVDEELLAVALSSLEEDYDLIGLTEHLDISRNALCAIAGLPPAREIPIVNRSGGDREKDSEIADARDILEILTRSDAIVYQRAQALFDNRYRAIGQAYDDEAFETRYASRVLDRLRGTCRDGATFYSVHSPIVGSGFHGRDAGGTPICAVWSGPATCLTLYVPTLPDVPLSLLVWIRGYAAQRQREQIRVRVDGQPAAHRLVPAEGCADLLTIDACPARDFVRLDLEIDETLTSTEAGSEGYDDRKRGIAFDGYGWRLLHANGSGRTWV